MNLYVNKNQAKALSILMGVFFCLVLFGAPTLTHAAQEGLGEWGNQNTYSAGAIQRVPEGYGLTAIGYGSDDHQCIIGIKTAAVNPDGTIDNSSVDLSWRITTCASGAPRDNTGSEKFFNPTPGYVATGWSWGADTSGGSPTSDSSPADECYYQQYTNLTTGVVSNYGDPNTGTCATRGYQLSDLKAVVQAPTGRVIVGIDFNLDNDAVLDFLAMSNRQALPQTTTPPPAQTPTTCSLTMTSGGVSSSNNLTINVGQSVTWGIDTGAPGLQYFWTVVTNGVTTQSNVLGAGNNGNTPATETYTYNTAGTYNVFYTTPGDSTHAPCQSPTTTLTVNPAPPPPPPPTPQDVDLLINNSYAPAPITAGDTATVSWGLLGVGGAGNYSACQATANPAVTDWNGAVALVGPKQVNFPTAGTFALNISCNKLGGGITSVTRNITVNVAATPPPTPTTTTCSLAQSAGNVVLGGTINWTVNSNATGLPFLWTVVGPTPAQNQTNVPGGLVTTPATTYTYTYNTLGTYSQVYFTIPGDATHTPCQSNILNLTVNSGSTPPPPPTPQNVDLLINNSYAPAPITAGDTATVSWGLLGVGGAGNYSACQATANPAVTDWNGAVALVGPKQVNFPTAGTFALNISCNKLGGGITSVTRNITVNVASTLPPTTTTCTVGMVANGITGATNMIINVGQSVTWTIGSTPPGLQYFWTVVTNGVTTQSNVLGAGNNGSTPANETYTYNTPATYQVYFTIPASSTHTACQSPTATLTVNAGTPPPPPSPLPPVITLLGANPFPITMGQTFVDPGATALDPQDGNITNKIVVTGSVDTTTVGTYTLTYNVTDAEGLSAIPVKRTVVVSTAGGGPGTPPTGSVSFCLVLADSNNVIATTSAEFPGGQFSLQFLNATTSSTALQTPLWDTNSFVPNKKTILNVNDSDCITYNNLALGTYYYSSTTINGAGWAATVYNDQDASPINNVFDFFPYSPELFNTNPADDGSRNLNSDGQITLSAGNPNRTVTILQKDNPGLMCLIPQITSGATDTATVGSAYSYTFVASSTSPVTLSVTSLPPGLSFNPATNIISGTPTTAGTFNITLTATNQCIGGLVNQTLVLTINPAPIVVAGCSANCGGNPGGGGGGGGTPPGGGGGNGPVQPNELTIFNEQVVETVPGIAMVTWNTNLPATRRVLYDTVSHPNVLNTGDGSSNYGYVSSTEEVVTPLLTAHGMAIPVQAGQTYYFREISTAVINGVTSVAIGKELTLTPAGAATTTTTTTTTAGGSCRYLYDYMRKDLNNNPVEVTKLQIFLKDIEGYNYVNVNGVYDDATVQAVNAFQVKYGNDILVPWGYASNAPTGYEYILTQKKVNEIYCGFAFPLTPLQQNEITTYRNFLQSLQNAGIISPQTPPLEDTTTVPIQSTIVGEATTTTPSLWSVMSANVLYSIGWAQCPLGIAGWLWLLLLIIIIILSYYLYKERQNTKRLEEANKQLDLENSKK